MTFSPNWITAIAASVTAFGIVLIAVQILISYLQMRNDHERSRRQKATDMMQLWAVDLMTVSPKIALARELVETLDENQCISLWRSQPFSISPDLKGLAEACILREISNTDDNQPIHLNIEDLIAIRTQVTGALNLLECVATAWLHNVADREILEEEYGPIIIPEGRRRALYLFRSVTGAYKALSAFEEQIEKNNALRQGKKKISY